MKRVKRKSPLREEVFAPGSLVRVPPLESARAHAVGGQSVVELKTTRVKRRRCPICGVRVADAEVQIGPVTVGVCSACASPVLYGLQFIGALKRFL